MPTTMREISESEATGIVAQVYRDIREVQGLAIVNLIWRRLAVRPEALEWAWSAARPLYESGAAHRHAVVLAESLDLPRATTPSPEIIGLIWQILYPITATPLSFLWAVILLQ